VPRVFWHRALLWGRAAVCASERRSQAPRSLRYPPHRWGLRGWCCSAHCPDAQLWLPTSNFARNSSMTHSNIEFASAELQRFSAVSKNDRDKLRARFGWRWCRRRPLRPSALRGSLGALAHFPASPWHPRVPQSGPLVPPEPSMLAVGVLQH